MMRKIFFYIAILFPVLLFSQNGGVSIGTNGTVHSSAILEIGNLDNKGVLFPKIELLDNLSDTTSPIANPVNGMIVYNIGNAQIHGYYFWDHYQWKLMGDSYNVVTDAVWRSTTPISSFLTLENAVNTTTVLGSYKSVDSNTWFELSNNIPGFVGETNGKFLVPMGSYLVHVNANITIPNLNSTGGIYNDVHLMKLRALLRSDTLTLPAPTTYDLYGKITGDNGVMRATEKTYNTNFDFSFTLDSPKLMSLAMLIDSGGTYSNGVGGNAPNDGSFTINTISIHFQRIIAAP